MEIERLVERGGCTGCACCYASCPFGAVAMAENASGEVVPMIESSKCTECRICEKRCPQLTSRNLHPVLSCYAAWADDPMDRKGSSSGGMGHVLASTELARDGAVCGCVMERDGVPKHIIVKANGDLTPLRGSKYVQSDMSEAYSGIRERLKSGEEVLFVGTPCQVAGLRSFVGNIDGHLFTVDLICHGTPPARYLREHLRRKTGKSDFLSVSFREDDEYVLKTTLPDGADYSGRLGEDLYLSSFMCGDINRESCYSCPYARPERTGDLTIGDFWGLDRTTLVNEPPRCVSVVLQNTDKGAELLERIGELATLERRELKEAVDGNDQLRGPSTGTDCRKAFREAITNREFDEAVRRSGLAKRFLLRRIRGSRFLDPLRCAKRLIAGKG